MRLSLLFFLARTNAGERDKVPVSEGGQLSRSASYPNMRLLRWYTLGLGLEFTQAAMVEENHNLPAQVVILFRDYRLVIPVGPKSEADKRLLPYHNIQYLIVQLSWHLNCKKTNQTNVFEFYSITNVLGLRPWVFISRVTPIGCSFKAFKIGLNGMLRDCCMIFVYCAQ